MDVKPEASIDQSVDGLIGAAYGSAGERCMAISVAVVGCDVAESIMPKLIEGTKAFKRLNGSNLPAEMGPIVTSIAHERIPAISRRAPKKGPSC